VKPNIIKSVEVHPQPSYKRASSGWMVHWWVLVVHCGPVIRCQDRSLPRKSKKGTFLASIHIIQSLLWRFDVVVVIVVLAANAACLQHYYCLLFCFVCCTAPQNTAALK